MLNYLPNIDIQSPRKGRVSTRRSINRMDQQDDYDSDNDLDAVYNVLLTQVDNIDESTSVDIMRALRKTGRPVRRKKPNPNAMLPPQTWKRAPPEFKKVWLQLDEDFKVEMLNSGKKNSELITTSPAPNAAFLADMLFNVNNASATYDLDDSGYETAHKDQNATEEQDTITVLNTLVNKAKRKLERVPAIKRGVNTNPSTLDALKQRVAPDASAMKLLANQKPGLAVDAANEKSYVTLEISPEQAKSIQQKSNCAIRHIKMAISQTNPPPPGLFHCFDQLDLQPISSVPQQTTQYTVQNYNAAIRKCGGLIDSGANGGLTDGKTMRVMEMIEHKFIDVSGVGNHTINKIPLGVFCTVHQAKPTPFIGVYHN